MCHVDSLSIIDVNRGDHSAGWPGCHDVSLNHKPTDGAVNAMKDKNTNGSAQNSNDNHGKGSDEE
jgi:hypothetical protein